MSSRLQPKRAFIQRPLDLPAGQQRAEELLLILQQAADKINGKLSEGTGDNGSPCGNFEGIWWYNTTPGVADADFTIIHNLGYVPKSYEIRWANMDARIYTSPATAPTQQTLTLRCTAISATLRIKIS